MTGKLSHSRLTPGPRPTSRESTTCERVRSTGRPLEVHDHPLQVPVVPGAHPGDGVRVAGHAPGFHHLGVARRVSATRRAASGGEEQLDQRLGVVAERRVVDDGGEAAQRALGAQPVHAALDRGRRQRDATGDVVVRAPAVFDQQRKNLSISGVHTEICCEITSISASDTAGRS